MASKKQQKKAKADEKLEAKAAEQEHGSDEAHEAHEDGHEAHEDGHEHVHLKSSNKIEPGEFFALIPPDDDIHQITTTSDVTSVSLHLLTNDTGCIWRNRYDQETGMPSPFRSGYVNAECDDEHDHQHDHTHSHSH